MRRAALVLSIASATAGACSAFGSSDDEAEPRDASDEPIMPSADAAPLEAAGDAVVDAGRHCDPAGPWKTEPIPRLTGPTAVEVFGTFTQDQFSIYFGTTGSGFFRIARALRTSLSQPFSQPAFVDLQTGAGAGDHHPVISANATEIIFTSDRSGKGFRLYIAKRASAATAFSPPALLLSDPAGATFSDRTASLAPNGDLWFGSTRFRGTEDIAVAKKLADGGYDEPVAVVPLNTTSLPQLAPNLTRDGRALFFSRFRPNTTNEFDVFVARRENPNAAFSEPQIVPTLSSFPQTLVSWISDDGCTLLVSRVETNVGQLYLATQ